MDPALMVIGCGVLMIVYALWLPREVARGAGQMKPAKAESINQTMGSPLMRLSLRAGMCLGVLSVLFGIAGQLTGLL